MFRPWFMKYLMKPDPGDKGGGGGGGKKTAKPKGPPADDSDDVDEDQEDAEDDDPQAVIADLRRKLKTLEAKKRAKPVDDVDEDQEDAEDDLSDKASRLRKKREADSGKSKALASAIKFDLASKDWLKTNTDLLPKGVAGLFEIADRDTWEDPIEKDSALKAGIIQEFFALQENVDLLTESQKVDLEDFQKLTKTSRQEHAQKMYDRLFEPTFEQKKRLKKAAQVSRGHADETDFDSMYKQKMIQGSEKHYLGVKDGVKK